MLWQRFKRILASILLVAMFVSNAGFSTLAMSVSYVVKIKNEADTDRMKGLSYRYYEQFKAERQLLLMGDEAKDVVAGAGAEKTSTDNQKETTSDDSLILSESKNADDNSLTNIDENKNENKDNENDDKENLENKETNADEKISTSSDAEDAEEDEEEITVASDVEEPEEDETTKAAEEEATATTSDAENENEDNKNNENNEEAEEDIATISDAEKIDDEEDEKEEKVATDSDADNIDVNEATASDINVDETGSVATVSEADTATASEFSLSDLKPLVASESDTNLFGADSIYNVGDKVYFGRYQQHTDGGLEPIEWHIVAKSGNTATLLADKILFKKAMDDDNTKTKYEDTALKSYLNSTTYNSSMFNDDERAAIVKLDDKRGRIGIPYYAEMSSWKNIDSVSTNCENVAIVSTTEYGRYWFADDANSRSTPGGYSTNWYVLYCNDSTVRAMLANSIHGVRLCIKVDLSNDVFTDAITGFNWDMGSNNWSESDWTWASMTDYRGSKYMTVPKTNCFTGFNDSNGWAKQVFKFRFDQYVCAEPNDTIIVAFDGQVNVYFDNDFTDSIRTDRWFVKYNMYDSVTNRYGKYWGQNWNSAWFTSGNLQLANTSECSGPSDKRGVCGWLVNGENRSFGWSGYVGGSVGGGIEVTPIYSNNGITWDLYDGTSTTITGSWNGTAGPDEYTLGTGLDPLPTNVIGPTGRQFDHWEIGGTTVTKISTTDTGDKTIKAVYKDISYNINYKESKSSLNPTKTTTRKYSDSYTLDLSPSWTKTGYTFLHWNNAEDDTKITKIEAKTTKDITVYPVWKENEYRIYYFDSRTATTPMKVATRSYTKAGVLDTTAAWEKTGYTLALWRNKLDDSMIMHVEPNTTLDVSVYAEWSENTYKVKYLDAKNSSTVRKSVDRKYTASVNLDVTASWTRNGYKFIKWKNNETDVPMNSVAPNIATDILLYPVWEQGYVFPKTWLVGVDGNLSSLTSAEMRAIRKIKFSKYPEAIATGFTKTWQLANSGGLEGYLYGDTVVVYAPEDLTIYMDPDVESEYFYGATYGGSNILDQVTTIENLTFLDTSKMTSMEGMFTDMKALTSLDLSEFDTSKVTNMKEMFSQCNALTKLDLSSFDTSNVTTMECMFINNKALTDIDLSNFNTSKVTNMSFMFGVAEKLTLLDIASFDTSNVTNMSNMFASCTALKTIKVHDGFVTTRVTSSGDMFNGCDALTGMNGTKYSIALVKDASYAVIDGDGGRPGYLTEATYTLTGYWMGGRSAGSATYEAPDRETVKTLKKITFSKYPEAEPTGATFTWDVYKSEGLKGYIVGDEAIIYAPKDRTIFLDEEASLFFSVLYGADNNNALSGVTEINNLGIIDTSKTTNMRYMFYLLRSVEKLDLSGFDTSNVTNMESMFYYCSALTELKIDSFNTSKVTSMVDMFGKCSSLKELNLKNFNTENVTSMELMFREMSQIKVLNLGSFKTNKVTDMDGMFKGCSSLEDILVNGTKFITTAVTESTDMFKDCFKLTGRVGTRYTNVIVTGEDHGFGNRDKTFARIDDGWDTTTPGYFCDVTEPRPEAFFRNNKAIVTPTVFPAAGLAPGWYEELGFTTDKTTITKIQMLTDAEYRAMSKDDITEVKYTYEYVGDTKVATYSFIIKGTEIYFTSGLKADGTSYEYSVSGYNTSLYMFVFPTYIEDVSGLFEGFTSVESITEQLVYIDADGFYTQNADDFAGPSLKGKVKYARNLFKDCNNLKFTNLCIGVTPNDLTDIEGMFENCYELPDKVAKNFFKAMSTTVKLENVKNLFKGCKSLTQITLDNFNTENLTNTTSMFDGCTNLERIMVSRKDDGTTSFEVTNVTQSIYMFKDTFKLKGSRGSVFTTYGVRDKSFAKVDGGTSDPGYFTLILTNTSNKVYLRQGWWTSTFDKANITNINFKVANTIPDYYDEEFIIDATNNTYGYRLGSVIDIYADTTNKKVYGDGSWNAIFKDFTSLTSLDFTNVDTKEVNNMASLFENDENLTSINFTNFNTASVSDMSSMFKNVKNIETLNLSTFDTSKVTDMSSMFEGATNVKVLNLGTFNTANVTNMTSMFSGSKVLEDILVTSGRFVTTAVTESTDMFKDCFKLTGRVGTRYTNVIVTGEDKGFGNQDVTFARIDTGWDTTTPGYFCDVTEPRPEAFFRNNKDAQQHDLSVVDNIYAPNASLAPGWYEKLGFNTEKTTVTKIQVLTDAQFRAMSMDDVTETRYIYEYVGDVKVATYSFIMKGTELYITNGLKANNTIYTYSLNGYSSDLYLYIVPTYAEDISGLFEGFTNVESIMDSEEASIQDSDKFYTANYITGPYIQHKTKYARNLFKGCNNLKMTNLAIGVISSNLIDVEGMFENCHELPDKVEKNFFKWMNTDTRWTTKLENVKNLFKGCKSLTELNLATFDTTEATDMSSMFDGCENVKVLNLGSFNTANVTNMTSMFAGCAKLEDILVDGTKFITTAVTESTDMFKDCFKLTGRVGTRYTNVVVTGEDHGFGNRDKTFARIDTGWDTTTPGYFCDVTLPRPEAFFRNNKANVISAFIPAAGLAPGWYEELGFTTDKTTITKIQMLTDAEYRTMSKNDITETKYTYEYVGDTKVATYSFIIKGTELYFTTGLKADGTSYEYSVSGYSDKTSLYMFVFPTYIEDVSGLFEGFTSVESITEQLADIDANGFYTQNAADFGGPFLKGKVKYARNLFKDCNNLKFTNLCIGVTPNDLTDIEGMFENCYELTDKVAKNFFKAMSTTVKLENVKNLFKGCKSLTELNLSAFDTSEATDMTSMFDGCEKLAVIYVDETKFTTNNVTNSQDMFNNCPYLIGGAGTSYAEFGNRDKSYAVIDKGATRRGYLSIKAYILKRDWFNRTAAGISPSMIEKIRFASFSEPTPAGTHWTIDDGLKAYLQNLASGNFEVVIKADDATKVYAPNDSSYLFSYILDSAGNMTLDKFDAVTTIENIEYIDTTRIINASHMFEGMTNISSIDLSNNKFNNLKDLSSMFKECENLTTLELGTNFDTSKVTNMSSMFEELSTIESLPTERLVTTEVMDMNRMFYNTFNLGSLDVHHFDTSKVTNMLGMFYQAGTINANNLELDLSNFNTSNVTNMASMFSFANIATLSLTNFDTKNVTSMAGMFAYSMNLQSLTLGTGFDTSKVEDMSYMFTHCINLDEIPVHSFDTKSVKNMANMFEATLAQHIDVSNFDTSSVENMSNMFRDSHALATIDLTHFNTSKVTNMVEMFAFTQASHEYTLDLSSFDTSKVTDMTRMFSNAYMLHTIYVSDKFVINSVTASAEMFHGCGYLAGQVGTTYQDSNPKDKTYAVIDGFAGQPGYFSGATHIVTFDAGDGYFPTKSTGGKRVNIATVSAYYGAIMETIKPEDPVSNYGYEFKGWRVKDGALMDQIYEFDTDATYEAIYQSNKWTKVKLNAGIGSFANGEKWRTVYVDKGYDTKRFEEPTATGYTFDNFYIGDEVLKATWSTASEQEVEVVAKYVPYNYYIVYNGNGATSGAMEMEIATYGEPHKLSKNVFEKDGWEFSSWRYFIEGSDAVGEFAADEAEVLNLTSEKNGVVKLSVAWVTKTFKVYFDGNGAISVKKAGALFGANEKSLEEQLIIPGKVNAEVDETESIENETSTSLFGASVKTDMTPQVYNYGLGSLPENLYQRPGYQFLGWSLSPDSSVVYNDGAEFGLNDIFEQEITLYAKWLPKKEFHANLVLQANGGTINGVEQAQLLMSYGEVTPRPTIEREGYVFDYWEIINYRSLGLISILTPTGQRGEYPETCDFKGVRVLRAHWKPANYKVRFYDNFDENKYKEIIATVGELFFCPETTIAERGNARFLGWSQNKDATFAQDNKGKSYSYSSIKKDSVVNFYAIWDRDRYIVKLHGIDPEKDIDDETNVHEETFTYGKDKYIFGIKESIATISGVEKVFAGWSIDRNATKMSYYDAAISDRVYDDLLAKGQGITTDVQGNKVVDLWPVWVDKLNASYIIFDADGGTIKGNKAWTVTYEAGKVIEYPKKSDLYRKGYEISEAGDWVDKDGNVYNETYAKAEGEVHLYANWNQKTYTIEYVGSGDETILTATSMYGASVNRTMPGGEKVTIPDNDMFERPGYDFIGWDTNPEADTVVYKVGQVVEALGDADTVVKLYTVWQPRIYTIYYYDGEDNLIGTNSFIYTKNVRLLPNDSMQEGVLDAGFTYEVNGEVKKFSSGQSISAEELSIDQIERDEILTEVANNTSNNTLLGSIRNTIDKLFGSGNTEEKKTKLFGDPSTTGGIVLKGATTKQIYTLTFDANGGVFSDHITTTKTATISNGDSMTGKWPEDPTGPTDFLGWAVEFDDGTKMEWTDPVYTLNESIRFTAQWSRGFVARLDANGGRYADGSTVQRIPMRKDASTVAFEIPTYVGHEFDNYYVPAVGGDAVLNDTWTYFANDETNVVAHWKPYNYKIVYDANGGTGYMPYEIATYNLTHRLPANSFVRDGYNFSGWYVDALNTTQAEYTDVYNLTPEKDGVTYVRATWAPLTYDVVYNANEGTGYMAPDTGLTYGVTHKLKANTFTRTGYTFRGWSLATGSDITYYDKATISDATRYNGTLNLYAEWVNDTDIYGTLKLHGNEGLINGSSYVEIPLRYHETLVEPELIRDGYKFTNWTDNSGNVVTYPTICDFTELELTANWAAVEYDVRYYANGGTFTSGETDFVDEANITYGTKFNLKASTDISRQHYTLDGWKQYTDNGYRTLGLGTEQTNLSKVDGDTVGLYAMWSGDAYTITLHQVDPAGVNMAADTVTNFTYGGENYLGYIARKIATVSNIGYEFAGWAVASERNKVRYLASQDADVIYENEALNSIELWPVWVNRNDLVYVTFDGNEGLINGAMRWVVPFATGSELVYPISANVKRFGYTHNGWLDSDKVTAFTKTVVDFTDDKVIYANWLPGNYTIEYVAIGGNGIDDVITGSMTSETKSTSAKVSLKGNAYQRIGYTFEGWDINPDAKVAIYADNASNLDALGDVGETIKLYTVWKAKEYTVTYKDYQDNVIGTDTLVYGSTVRIPANTNVPIGYKDAGFELEGHANVKFAGGRTVKGTDLKVDNSTNLTTGIVLKGTVEKIVYVITFDANGGTFPDARTIATAAITYGDRVSTVKPGKPTNGVRVFSGYIVDGAFRDVDTLTYDYTSNKTFVADWNGVLYKIEYNSNTPVSPDATKVNVVAGAPMATQSALANRDTQINQNLLSVVGYNFIGWATASYTAKAAEQMRDNHDPRIIGNRAILNLDKASDEVVTLYAMWGRNRYRLTMVQNEDTAKSSVADPYATASFIYYDELLSDNAAFSLKTRTNYTFTNKWIKVRIAEPYARSKYNGTDYLTTSDVYRVTSDLTLYPLWTNDERVITLVIDSTEAKLPDGYTNNTFIGYLDAPLNTIGTTSEPKLADGKLVTPIATPYEMKLFDYWSTVKGDDTTRVDLDALYDGTFTSIYANVRYRQEYLLSYNANGGQGHMASSIMREGIRKETQPNAFTKSGYIFGGWTDQYGVTHKNGFTVDNPTCALTLYANWNEPNSGSYFGGSFGGGGGGGGGGGAIPSNLDDGFLIRTLIPITDYTFKLDELGLPIGIKLKKSSNLAKALLNSMEYTTRYKMISGDTDNIELISGFYNLQKANGSNYYLLDMYGKIKTGFVTVEKVKAYTLDAATNTLVKIGDTEGGKYYLLVEQSMNRGILYNQPIVVDGVKYLFDTGGKVISATAEGGVAALSVTAGNSDGWKYDPVKDTWSYFKVDAEGNVQSYRNGVYSILAANNNSYYYIFDENGIMKTGLTEYNGNTYYLVEEGALKGSVYTGIITLNNKSYMFDASGAMVTALSNTEVR